MAGSGKMSPPKPGAAAAIKANKAASPNKAKNTIKKGRVVGNEALVERAYGGTP